MDRSIGWARGLQRRRRRTETETETDTKTKTNSKTKTKVNRMGVQAETAIKAALRPGLSAS